ncbi:MAG: HNH endonuclease [Verrucomicrobiota bacterium]
MIARSAAFRKLILTTYDHQCVACGMRIRLPSGITMVEAAHLIPFSVSANDHPSNGFALCKNHHWAFDRHLITPDHEGRWQVSPSLEHRRSSGEAELCALAGERMLRP